MLAFRPDLPGRARENAAELYASLHDKLLTLPDELEIYPGHFSGSVCGTGLSGKPTSTLAFEKRWNPTLSLERQAFIDSLRGPADSGLAARDVLWRTTFGDRNLSAISQAGLINNLNDGMAWGLFPLLFAAMGMTLSQIGLLAAIYPATRGIAQVATGGLSDRIGRKWLIAGGMWAQAVGIVIVSLSDHFVGFAAGAGLLGLGTAMVYPTLLAAIGDVAHPCWRASSVGVYRMWRDLGYAVGAVLAGVSADVLGLTAAIQIVGLLTFVSGLIAAVRMHETLRPAMAPLTT